MSGASTARGQKKVKEENRIYFEWISKTLVLKLKIAIAVITTYMYVKLVKRTEIWLG